jgi:hypothetical protein
LSALSAWGGACYDVPNAISICIVVSDDYDGLFISNEYPTFDCIDNAARVEFVIADFKPRTYGKKLPQEVRTWVIGGNEWNLNKY